MDINIKFAEKLIDGLMEWLKTIDDGFGFIERREPIIYDGIPGALVWDYVIYNEITFVERETGKKHRLYTNIDDGETRLRYDEYLEKYGISK